MLSDSSLSVKICAVSLCRDSPQRYFAVLDTLDGVYFDPSSLIRVDLRPAQASETCRLPNVERRGGIS